jgi:putative hydrolase of the HAD superfamily
MQDRNLVIGFDADDTLWHNENLFAHHHGRFCEILKHYHDSDTVERTLFSTEMRNLDLYGYGIKSFMLSSIETAISLTDGKISATEIRQLLDLGREMLSHPITLIEGVSETLAALSPCYQLLVITKGDLRDQERKLANSGLAHHFRHIEIVSEKNRQSYAAIFRRHAIEPDRFLMVGNSLKSDIAPLLSLGAAAVHLPYPITWAHEHIDELPTADGRFFKIDTMSELPAIIAEYSAKLT